MDIPINYWAVLVATVVNMVVGFLWYGPLFGKMWMRMMGYTKENMQGGQAMMVRSTVLGIVLAFLMNYVLAHVIVFGDAYTGLSGVSGGLMGAFWLWLGFVVPLTANSYLWEMKPLKLWVLHAANYLVTLLIAGAIIGAWI
jgi:hypothetical protein